MFVFISCFGEGKLNLSIINREIRKIEIISRGTKAGRRLNQKLKLVNMFILRKELRIFTLKVLNSIS